MAQRSLAERVQALEETVAGVQEIRGQLASMNSQMNTRFGQIDARFEQVDARFEQIDSRFGEVDARFDRLERIVRDGDDRNYSQMRLLHEELIARIATIGERGRGDGPASPRNNGRKRRKPKR